MTLSCSCNYEYYEFDPGQWSYLINLNSLDFLLLDTQKRRRCCSCNKLINLHSPCIRYTRKRYPYNEIESRIKTGLWLEDSMNQEPTITMSYHYHCERCGEIYLNLYALGYECLLPNENMEEALKEYQELSGFSLNKK